MSLVTVFTPCIMITFFARTLNPFLVSKRCFVLIKLLLSLGPLVTMRAPVLKCGGVAKIEIGSIIEFQTLWAETPVETRVKSVRITYNMIVVPSIQQTNELVAAFTVGITY